MMIPLKNFEVVSESQYLEIKKNSVNVDIYLNGEK